MKKFKPRMKIFAGLIIISFLFGCSAKTKDTVTFEGVSMLPSIKDGEKIMLDRFDPNGEFSVKRGDVVMFLFPMDTSKFYVKRVVGLPNETVEIREGKVFIDGKELSESYVEPKFNQARTSQPPIKVKADYYYVMGDNRDSSSDSRFWGLCRRRIFKPGLLINKT